MAGTLTSATRDRLLDSIGLKTIKLHSQDPTEAGTVGVIPGAQKDFTVGAAENGVVSSNATVEIDITVQSGTVTVSHYSLWDADGECVATGALSSAQSYTASGKYIVNTLTVDLNK